jgi:hypothetical protein
MMRNTAISVLALFIALLMLSAIVQALPDSSTQVQGQNCMRGHYFNYNYDFAYDRQMVVGQSYDLTLSFGIGYSAVTTNPYTVDASISGTGFEVSQSKVSLSSGPKTITIKPTSTNGKISITGRLTLNGNERQHPGYVGTFIDSIELNDFSITQKSGTTGGSKTNVSGNTTGNITANGTSGKTINKTITSQGNKTTVDYNVSQDVPSPIPWYIVRISGMAAFVMLGLSVLIGLLRKLDPKKFGRLFRLISSDHIRHHARHR